MNSIPSYVARDISTRLIRRLAGVLVGIMLVSGLMTVAPAYAHGPKTWWPVIHPFGSSYSEAIFTRNIKGKKRKIDLSVGAGSAYQVRKLRWKKWGTKQTVGRGKVRYCSDSCEPWRKAKIVLDRRGKIDCYHGAGDGKDVHRIYYRSKVWGFEYLQGGYVSKRPRGTVRCD